MALFFIGAAMNFSSWAWDIDFGFTSLIVFIIGTTAVCTGTYIGRGLPAQPVTTEQPQTPSPSAQQDPPAPR
ncbi:hypothetical protein NBM05_08445 [Rothia sp. AR01]|uniref:Uncharacterized protein n=1 Tax=Rothia santali TaxID=2949643 RepID=A0A9X2HD08_9MICC|nr:hypothetical protein [Rothia santali]MCP3426030.1 hypothetical protein [Rothia santali]